MRLRNKYYLVFIVDIKILRHNNVITITKTL